MDGRLLDSSICGISQARILEWVAFLPPGIEPVSPVAPARAGRFFTAEPPGKPNLLGLSSILGWGTKTL